MFRTINRSSVTSLDESFLPHFASNTPLSSSVGTSHSILASSMKLKIHQSYHQQVKSYANLLFDEGDLSLATNVINDQRQPMLLIDERDLSS